MLPKIHLLSGLLLTIPLYLLNVFTLSFLLLIILSTILIDIDHYFFYIYKKKSWNLKKAYIFFKEKKKSRKNINHSNEPSLFLFHGVEWVIIFALLGLYLTKYAFAISIGFFLHLLLDWTEIIQHKYKIHKISVLKDYSTYRAKQKFKKENNILSK